MGGFEGGDEGGFWDIDMLSNPADKQPKNTQKAQSYIEKSDSAYSIKAHAKATVFLKITGERDKKLTLLSRVIRLEDLYDTISFIPSHCENFTIEGCDNIPVEENSIYKAYQALINYTADTDIEEFFKEHKVVVTKRIASSAGLGGASSDAAAFMHLLKEVCNLILSTNELANIGSSIDSSVPFFIYNYPSANVSGFGEIVEPFEEKPLDVQLYTPNIVYDSTLVCQTFRQQLITDIALSTFEGWDKLDSKSIIERISDPVMLNDLYAASLLVYPDLKKEAKKGWFFSGSTFFKPHN